MPVSQTQVIEKPKVICAVATLQDSKHNITAQVSIPNNYINKLDNSRSYFNIHQTFQLTDVFAYLHIKVPARILHQQFLI